MPLGNLLKQEGAMLIHFFHQNFFLTLKIFVRNGLPVKIAFTERANVSGYASNT